MKRPDPTYFLNTKPRTKIIFSSLQSQGARENQEDFFANFNDECFVIADGVGGMPHGEVAARLAVETAIWGYRQIRLRETYWSMKRFFLNRIFRSVNIAVWQKHRESGFTGGLASTLLVLITAPRNFFIGSVGDSSAFLYHQGKVTKLTHDDLDDMVNLTKVIGVERFGLVPQVFIDRFEIDDTLLLTTDGIGNFVTLEELNNILSASGTTEISLNKSLESIFEEAQKNGSKDNMTAYLVKRLKND